MRDSPCYLRTRRIGVVAQFVSINSRDRMEYARGNEVRDDGGEGGSDGKEEPAIALPEFAEAGGLSEDIRDVGCAVGDVRDDGQQEKTQSGIKREDCPGCGISGYEVDDDDGRQYQVVGKPPRFPEFDGVGDVVLQARGVHAGSLLQSWGSSNLRNLGRPIVRAAQRLFQDLRLPHPFASDAKGWVNSLPK